MCLLCQTQSGMKKEDFDSLRKNFIQNYGYEEIITMMNLQDAKLFRVKDKKLDWNKIKKVRDIRIILSYRHLNLLMKK